MKKIRRISPPKRPNLKWHVQYRPAPQALQSISSELWIQKRQLFCSGLNESLTSSRGRRSMPGAMRLEGNWFRSNHANPHYPNMKKTKTKNPPPDLDRDILTGLECIRILYKQPESSPWPAIAILERTLGLINAKIDRLKADKNYESTYRSQTANR